jgi:hypothetical protein
MKKQKKKIKNQNKLNIDVKNIKKLTKKESKECHHYHLDNNGNCCHCTKINVWNYILKNI